MISSPITYLPLLSHEQFWLLLSSTAVETNGREERRHSKKQVSATTRREGFRAEEMRNKKIGKELEIPIYNMLVPANKFFGVI